ncbi:kinase-like domain-containing protein [Roridomyces roridus]|uniref:Kinase-like domain-containing protein n=1 Tax=Roridomyces roridus TaxID=1738132 RepID=A0AAD7F760_9AGAR|nr:kinase-like domain-containing protein [Roridomyces roridus]
MSATRPAPVAELAAAAQPDTPRITTDSRLRTLSPDRAAVSANPADTGNADDMGMDCYDASNSSDEDSSSGDDAVTTNFVTKLYQMITDPGSSRFVSWTELGTSFFSSFARQLIMYGFHRINRIPRAQRTISNAQTFEFFHHKFLRGRPDLVGEIKHKALEPDSALKLPESLSGPQTPPRDKAPEALGPELQALPVTTEDPMDVCEWLDGFFRDKWAYTKFLACRGESAQLLLDLLQDLLDQDYDLNLGTINRRRIFKALIRLSGDSKLHPQCLNLVGLEQEKLVAGGAFSDVYKGLLCDQNVAVKMIRVFEDSDIDALLKEFSREALIWWQLYHPNLLPFFGMYYLHGRLCLVSPWMDNGHLRAFLKKGSCETDRLLSLILDVALGLAHLHEKGVVHGDLKGENIFITPSFRACIADFGLSSIITPFSSIRFTNSSKRTQGGTIRYQAPELHRGGENDLRSDIYAFACVVYEMLTGKPPFPELYMDGAVIQVVLEGRRPSRPLSCPDNLWNLLQDCWKEQADSRPSASEVVERLEGPDIQAIKAESTPDWDERFTAKFRPNLRGPQESFELSRFELIIFGYHGQSSF